jgi:hypothetical protein
MNANRSEDSGTTRLDSHAEENLRFIRDTMERASVFTAVPGWGALAIGVIGLIVALITRGIWNDQAWATVWAVTATASFGIGIVTTARKIRASGLRMTGGAGARFWAGLVPTLAAGAILTVPLLRAGEADLLPTLWLLLYGAAVITAGWNSVRVLALMGLCFMLAGALATFSPSRDVSMAAGFGGLHVIFGYVIARRHGG